MIDFTRDDLGYVRFPTYAEQYAKEYVANMVKSQTSQLKAHLPGTKPPTKKKSKHVFGTITLFLGKKKPEGMA